MLIPTGNKIRETTANLGLHSREIQNRLSLQSSAVRKSLTCTYKQNNQVHDSCSPTSKRQTPEQMVSMGLCQADDP